MFTQCPHCQTYFRIHAEQLRAADGKVRCGLCQQIFNALEHLSEEPRRAAASSAALSGAIDDAHISDKEQAELAAFFADESLEETSASIEVNTFEIDISEETSEDLISNRQADDDDTRSEAEAADAILSRDEDQEFRIDEPDAEIIKLEGLRHMDDQPQSNASPLSRNLADDNPFGSSLAAETLLRGGAAETPRSRRWPWVSGIAVLLLLLAGQIVYFEREALARESQLRPFVEQFCHYLKCTIALPSSIEHIEFLDRDIHSHPAAPNSLIVNATFVNSAPFVQSYPDLQITFSNIMGQAVAMRRFTPQEYLTAGLSPTAGIPPDVPVRVEITILDPGPDAVNFEFSLVKPSA